MLRTTVPGQPEHADTVGGCTARTARQILNALNLDDRWGFTRARAATTITDLGIAPVSTHDLVTILRATTLPPLRHHASLPSALEQHHRRRDHMTPG